MAIFNYAAREMTAKIVYYGPGLSGKTSSIQYIHTKISPKNKGKLVSLATETDRTLFFDFFPVEFGQIGGFKVKFNFYTVPGQVFYNTTRKLVLKGADGVVFVADSQPGMMEQNIESLDNLKENLQAHGLDWETMPFVIQYNKRDLPGALPMEEMRPRLNVRDVPDFGTSATTGLGVMEAMKGVCKMVLEDIQRKQRRGAGKSAPATASKMPPTAGAEPVAPKAPSSVNPKVEDIRSVQARARETAKRTAPVEAAPSIQRTVVLPIQGPGTIPASIQLPLELTCQEGVEAVQIRVDVRVEYLTRGEGEVRVRELSTGDEPAGPTAVETPIVDPTDTPGTETGRKTTAAVDEPAEPPKKKGFFKRVFGSYE